MTKKFYYISFTRGDGAKEAFTVRHRDNGEGFIAHSVELRGPARLIETEDGTAPFFKTAPESLLSEVERYANLFGLNWIIEPVSEEFPQATP